MYTSELSLYYHNFCAGQWAHPNAAECACRGSGWACSELDTWHECKYHYRGQPHPEADLPTCYCEAPVGGICICAYITPITDSPDIAFDAAGNRLY